jgi:hypothetical protein
VIESVLTLVYLVAFLTLVGRSVAGFRIPIAIGIQVDKSANPLAGWLNPYEQRHTSRECATADTGMTERGYAMQTVAMRQHQQSAELSQRATAGRPETPTQTQHPTMRQRFGCACASPFSRVEPRPKSL